MSRAKLPREGRNRQVLQKRAADLLHEAPDKFKVMRGRAAQRERRPAAPHAAGLIPSASPHAHSGPPIQHQELHSKQDLFFPGEDLRWDQAGAAGVSSGAGLARAGGHGAAGAAGKARISRRLHLKNSLIVFPKQYSADGRMKVCCNLPSLPPPCSACCSHPLAADLSSRLETSSPELLVEGVSTGAEKTRRFWEGGLPKDAP